MALAMNVRTGKTVNVPDHYIGHKVLGKDLEVLDGAEAQAAPKKENNKKTKQVAVAVESESNELVKDGTIWERLAGTKTEELPAPEIDIESNEENN